MGSSAADNVIVAQLQEPRQSPRKNNDYRAPPIPRCAFVAFLPVRLRAPWSHSRMHCGENIKAMPTLELRSAVTHSHLADLKRATGAGRRNLSKAAT